MTKIIYSDSTKSYPTITETDGSLKCFALRNRQIDSIEYQRDLVKTMIEELRVLRGTVKYLEKILVENDIEF